jgi:hypothetical protein
VIDRRPEHAAADAAAHDCVLPFLTTACQVRRLRISLPLVEWLVGGRKYFLADDLPPAAGEELRPLFRPRIAQAKAPPRPVEAATLVGYWTR